MLKTKKEKKQIKIGKLVIADSITELIIVMTFVLTYFLSPNIFLITTARFGTGSEADNNNVEIVFGSENTEERFKTYFQWYNVIHELGHGILRYNSDIKISAVEEEQLVNDFALAYWLYYGEEEKISELENIVNYAVDNIKSDAPEGVSYIKFAEENWNKPSFNTFNNYGWFQFSSVKESLNKRLSLTDVLKEMGIKNINLPEKELLQYSEINEKTSTQIINDAVENFHKWGLEFPEVYQTFSDNPNANYSKTVKNFLGLYTFLLNK